MKTILIEEDRVLRLLGVILDPNTEKARVDAFANFNSTDLDDFEGWCMELREKLMGLYPARVVMINSQEELQKGLASADIVVLESLEFGSVEIALAKQLKCLHQFGTVLKRIDVKACEKAGIKVLSIRRRTNIAMAEHTMMLCLTLAKRFPLITSTLSLDDIKSKGMSHIPFDTRHTASPNYARIPNLQTLQDSTLGLLGFGEIGKEVAKRANSFGMRIIVHQPSTLSSNEAAHFNVEQVSLSDLLSQSDFLSIHVPFSERTTDLIDESAFSLMKPTAFLINTARARIVNHDALVNALKMGTIAGAAFDVHYQEPIDSNEELLSFPQFIATPHVGGASRLNGLMDAQTLLMQCAQCFH
jgi:phosphoglycerate dehydrogenase-like enzyme